MIVEITDHGEKIINDDRATSRLQTFFDSIVQEVNNLDSGSSTATNSITNPTVITTAQSGNVFTITGATGTIEFDLPAATVGLKYSFARTASQSLIIDPDGTEVIGSGGAGKYLSIDTDNAFVTLQCYVAGAWCIVADTGVTSYEP